MICLVTSAGGFHNAARVIRRNQVYADCANLSVYLAHSFGIDQVHDFGPNRSKVIVI
jgi:hypothetical protein